MQNRSLLCLKRGQKICRERDRELTIERRHSDEVFLLSKRQIRAIRINVKNSIHSPTKAREVLKEKTTGAQTAVRNTETCMHACVRACRCGCMYVDVRTWTHACVYVYVAYDWKKALS